MPDPRAHEHWRRRLPTDDAPRNERQENAHRGPKSELGASPARAVARDVPAPLCERAWRLMTRPQQVSDKVTCNLSRTAGLRQSVHRPVAVSPHTSLPARLPARRPNECGVVRRDVARGHPTFFPALRVRWRRSDGPAHLRTRRRYLRHDGRSRKRKRRCGVPDQVIPGHSSCAEPGSFNSFSTAFSTIDRSPSANSSL